MRDIKFRVWDKENNKFFEPTYEAYKGDLEYLNIGLNGRLSRTISNEYGQLEIEDESLFKNQYVVQQYTGLKDNNGAEIYEGDIITTSPSGARCTEVLRGHYEDAYGAFDSDHYGLHTIKWGTLPDVISNGGVVIGNIYENPELLGETT